MTRKRGILSLLGIGSLGCGMTLAWVALGYVLSVAWWSLWLMLGVHWSGAETWSYLYTATHWGLLTPFVAG